MGIIEIPYAPIRREGHMTFEDLLDILAEQFSCDAAELSEDTSFEDLGVDAEDLVELAWQLGEATGTEVEEDRLKTAWYHWRSLELGPRAGRRS
ncbi:acyl carrier protein [human gut metagenome]|uniref:Acyl carrier protein n=1 Tax=human gut metagenome TaxID=408170 RepID=K1RTI7_9ZZZZ